MRRVMIRLPYQPVVPTWYYTGPAGPALLASAAAALLRQAADGLYASSLHGTQFMAGSCAAAAAAAQGAEQTIGALTVQGALLQARQGL